MVYPQLTWASAQSLDFFDKLKKIYLPNDGTIEEKINNFYARYNATKHWCLLNPRADFFSTFPNYNDKLWLGKPIAWMILKGAKEKINSWILINRLRSHTKRKKLWYSFAGENSFPQNCQRRCFVSCELTLRVALNKLT